MTEGLLPAVERSWEEETATVHDDDEQDPRTLKLDGTRDQRTSASDGQLGTVLRTMVVERSSGEETVNASWSATFSRGGARDFEHATC